MGLFKLILLVQISWAGTLRIGVIDSGFDITRTAKLCPTGHRSFVLKRHFSKTAWFWDNHGHGTNVVGLIENRIGDPAADYCIVIYKIFDPYVRNSGESDTVAVMALEQANKDGVDIVNLSYGGDKFIQKEAHAMHELINSGTLVIAAAGNEGKNLDVGCDFYPACYDSRIFVLGNLEKEGIRHPTSNYALVLPNFRWDVGTKQTANYRTLTGTSQAAANFTGSLARAILSHRRTPQGEMSEGDYRKVGTALVKQTGLDKYAKEVCRKLPLPKEVNYVYWLLNTAATGRVQYKYEF